jgi:hypothetical protein
MSGTDDLIGNLAVQAGAAPRRSAASFRRLFLLSSLLSLAIALALSVTGLGALRAPLPHLFEFGPFQYKMAGAALLACAAFYLARRAAIPGSARASWLLILPGIAPFLLDVILDPWGPPAGDGGDKVNCAVAIALAALPALWLILRALKNAAPTRPGWTGALAGLLAGALGAAGHSLACYNDGGVMVALFYGAALIFMTGLGALIGRKTLRW